MAKQSFEFLVGGAPYSAEAEAFSFNTETRYRVVLNKTDEHIFTWDSRLGRLAAIDDDAGTIPDEVETAIARKLESLRR